MSYKELDELIELALKNEIESIDIDDKEIEKEWDKLQRKRKYTDKYKYRRFILVVATIILFFFMTPFITHQVMKL